MRLFFLIQSLQLLIICMDDLEYMANSDYVLFFFRLEHHQINHIVFTFRYCSNSVLHTFPTFAPYRYDVILSKVCCLLSSLLNAVLLNSPVNVLCASLLNLCCDFNMILSSCRQFLYLQI